MLNEITFNFQHQAKFVEKTKKEKNEKQFNTQIIPYASCLK